MSKRCLSLILSLIIGLYAVAGSGSAGAELPATAETTADAATADGDSVRTVVVKPAIIAIFVIGGADIPSEKKDCGSFAWGVDAGSAIDMTSNDMSAVDLNAYFGYRGRYLRFAGAGAGIDMMVSRSTTCYPVYALLRTDFSPTPRLLFLEARGGVSFNKIEEYATQTTPYISAGIGITLAKGRTFSSHIILSYNYTKLNDVALPDEPTRIRVHDLQAACIRIGITF